MAITQYTSISTYLNTIYERSLLVARETTLMSGLVTPYSAQGYMTRQFTTRPSVTMQVVADAVDYANPTTFGKSSVGTLTPTEKMAQIMLTDANVESDPDGARDQAAQELGLAVAEYIDTDLLALFSSFATDLGTANAAFTLTQMAEAVAVLRTRKVKSPVQAVVHPYHWHDIWVELGKPAATYPASGITDFMIQNYWAGNILGIPVYYSANIATNVDSDAVSGVFAREALALDTRSPYRIEPERDASLRAWELNAHVGYACGLGERPTFGIKLTADATAPS